MQRPGRLRLALAAALLLAGGGTAQARGGLFFGFGVPLYVAPPAYVAPYPYTPPYYAAPAAGGGCYAGPYVCPLEEPAGLGAPCSCPTNQGRIWGRAR